MSLDFQSDSPFRQVSKGRRVAAAGVFVQDYLGKSAVMADAKNLMLTWVENMDPLQSVLLSQVKTHSLYPVMVFKRTASVDLILLLNWFCVP